MVQRCVGKTWSGCRCPSSCGSSCCIVVVVVVVVGGVGGVGGVGIIQESTYHIIVLHRHCLSKNMRHV